MRVRRRGFTLVELIVTVGILSLLTSLIVPAVQKARESASKSLCAVNLHQIGLAAHQYDNDNRRLPPGYLGPSLAKNTDHPAMMSEGQWAGHLPLLLPYLEQQHLFRQISVNLNPDIVTPNPWFWHPGGTNPNLAAYAAAYHKLKIFRCPSAPDFEPQFGNEGPGGGGTVLGLHVFNSDTDGVRTVAWRDAYVKIPQYRYLGRTNYLGVAGCGSGTHPFYGRFEGIYTNRSHRSLAHVSNTDGTSNTLLYGETCGSHWVSRPETKDICWMGGGALGTYLGLHRGRTAQTIAFSSYHSVGVHFCFADRSVRLVRFGGTAWDEESAFTPDWLVLQQLAGWRDGGTANTASILD